MKIELREITVREVVKNYVNNNEEGVYGYDGKLNIRPKYQREFVYKDKQRNAVIETIRKNFPLNVMYWVKNEDETFELLDGQQRTVSICDYVNGGFSLNFQYFHNLTETEKNQILDYKLMIYFCEGNDKEKLDWFKTINIAGEKLTNQELLNAIYTGTWLSDAKKYFSKTDCFAYNIAKEYLSGIAIRQDYLETIISWISNGNIETYMAEHQHNPNAIELRIYFENVITWVKVIFPKYRKDMKGVDFGLLYNEFKNTEINPEELETKISLLVMDEDVGSKKGIYSYVLTGDERSLQLRQFSSKQKSERYEVQKGICAKCGEQFTIDEMEADHITPFKDGGRTTMDNCQMLCRDCNRRKSSK